VTYNRFDAFTHFFGSLIGKRQRHDVERINIFALDQVSDPIREHTCFARACTGN
jgi:hypothetical protein